MRPNTKTTAILVDGSNLHATYEALGLSSIDYKQLLRYFSVDGAILHAGYFTALPHSDKISSLRPMVDYLDYNGWHVYTKETKTFIDASGALKIKGNMDVEIAVIGKELAPFVTNTVLFTGDGDFRFLVDTLQRQHRNHVTVVSSIKTRPSMCADELRRQADTFIDLVDLHPHIGRASKTPVDAVNAPNGTRKFKFLNGG